MPYIGNIVQDFSVSTAMLNTDSVTSIKIDDGTIVTADLADDAVTTAKIADGNIVASSIASDAITTAKIANLQVTDVKLADNAVALSKIVDGVITNAKINASAAIAGTKISPDFGSQAIVTTGQIKIDGDGGSKYISVGDNEDFKIYHDATGPTIFSDANNQGLKIQAKNLNFTENTGVTTRFRINDDGHVDVIGNLDVGGDINLLDNGTIFGGSGAANTLILRSASGNANHSRIDVGVSEGSDNGGLHFYTAGSSVATRAMTIKGTSQNVGIGTDSPESNLHVHVSSASDGPFLRFTNPNGGDGTYLGRISCGDTAGTFFTGINFFKHDTDDGEVRFRMKVAGTNTDVLTLVDGNVGIGTTSPSTIFHVSDADAELTLERTGTHSTSDSPLIQFKGRGPNAVMYNFAKIDAVSTGSNNAGHLRFYTNASGTQAEKMRVLSGGQVNIGDDLTQTSRTVSIHGGGNVGQLQVKGTEADIWMYSTGPNTVWRLLGSTGANTHRFRIYDSTNGKEPFFIEGSSGTNTSHVHINSGNLKFDQAGTGIDFHNFGTGTGVTSNLLDDYETGTWTPALTSGFFSGETYTTQNGTYVKVGDQFTAWFYIQFNVMVTSGDEIRVNSPFTMMTGTNHKGSGIVSYHDFSNASLSHTVAIYQRNSADLKMYGGVGTVFSATAHTSQNSKYIIGVFTARTA